MYDVIIIGAGVSGSAVARELSRFKVDVCVIEKDVDVCCGTSKANSGIVHAGFDAEPGSLKARYNVEGSKMMGDLSKELDFLYKNIGSFVICTNEDEIYRLYELREKGIANGVQELEVITDRKRIFEMEPNLAENVVAILYAPSAGIVCPFNLNIALAENAYMNGVEFKFNTEVTDIKKDGELWKVETTEGIFYAKCIVNAAGVYADKFHNMVSKEKIDIIPRKGEYYLLDKSVSKHVTHTVFALPGKFGKGVLVSPTVEGNLIVGPTAYDIEDKEGVDTTQVGLDQIKEKAALSVKDIPFNQVITSFAGLRAHEQNGEFIVGEVKDAENFFDCAGIESPGLSSCPAIGKAIAEMISSKLNLEKNINFDGKRKGITRTEGLTVEEYRNLVLKNPAYGNIICRCETISEGEIIEAINRPLGAKTLDGIKRRIRAGAGRCQSGFCSPKVIEIIARETGMSVFEVTKNGKGSEMLAGKTK